MQIHQITNSIGLKIFNTFSYSNLGWNNHIHKCYELIMVAKGVLYGEINGKPFSLKKNQAMLVPPYFIHSYKKDEDCVYHIAVFSSDYVPAFDKKIKNLQPNNYLLSFSKEEWNYIEKRFFPALVASPCVQHPIPDEFTIKSCLYLMASCFIRTKEFTQKSKDYSILLRIVSYIEENFSQNISLSTLAENLSYDKAYVSRIFSRVFHINLKTFINMYRCEYAENLVESTSLPLSAIAMDSGFQSIRSFNRIFKEITGKTPSSIRKP